MGKGKKNIKGTIVKKGSGKIRVNHSEEGVPDEILPKNVTSRRGSAAKGTLKQTNYINNAVAAGDEAGEYTVHRRLRGKTLKQYTLGELAVGNKITFRYKKKKNIRGTIVRKSGGKIVVNHSEDGVPLPAKISAKNVTSRRGSAAKATLTQTNYINNAVAAGDEAGEYTASRKIL